MAAPTTEELIAALLGRGITMSVIEATGVLCLLDSITECLELNYPGDECRKSAILLYAALLLSTSTSGRYVTSQSAPSGASQSFAYGTKPWSTLYNQMRLLDPAGCTGDLVADPNESGKPFFKVVTGSRRCF